MATDTIANDRLLRALRRQPVDTTPVWIMRQAGRYLPEYRKVREKAGSFLTLAQTPELACEVTLQPLRRFELDAAIIFSDILTIPEAMGLGLHFVTGEGPHFHHPVQGRAAIDKLGLPDMEDDLGYVMDAIRTTRRELDGKLPLIGFSGSPWTLACYMVEGHGSRNFAAVKSLGYEDPGALHQLLDLLARAVTAYLKAQIAAGAQVVMLFDSWGGLLAPAPYREFSARYLARICAELAADSDCRDVPVIVFSKGANCHLALLAESGCAALGVDWTIDLADARRATAGKVALQGNLDPAVLAASPEVIRNEVARVLESYGDGPGHVFNLGHGITPDINPEHVAVLVDAVHELGRGRATLPEVLRPHA